MMDNKKYYYFAYGGNTNNNHMTRSYKDHKIFSIGLLKDYKLVFRKSLEGLKLENAYCDIDYKENEQVYGVIYELSYDDIIKLDKQEMNGVFYDRILVNVNIVDIKCEKKLYEPVFECITYIMKHKDKPYAIPSQRYYEVVIDGYLFHGLPLKQIYDAVINI